ncbi:MAG: F0F1 ATP synthase subunit epsilon [Phycisphaerales bacterium]|nr:F0F1 ATP synthase subunit epsilon [Phycisphaerales bacterium]
MSHRDLKFVLITPEREVLSQSVSKVVFTAHDGDVGVMPNRAPLMCELGVGAVTYTVGGASHSYFIEGGFAQVLDGVLTVLTDKAIPADELTRGDAEKADREARDATDPADRSKAHRRAHAIRALL